MYRYVQVFNPELVVFFMMFRPPSLKCQVFEFPYTDSYLLEWHGHLDSPHFQAIEEVQNLHLTAGSLPELGWAVASDVHSQKALWCWWFGCHQCYFPINIGLRLSSQLTKSYFSEGWPWPTNQKSIVITMKTPRVDPGFRQHFGSCVDPRIQGIGYPFFFVVLDIEFVGVDWLHHGKHFKFLLRKSAKYQLILALYIYISPLNPAKPRATRIPCPFSAVL